MHGFKGYSVKSLLLFTLLSVSASASASPAGPSKPAMDSTVLATVNNGTIRVFVHRYSGQFAVEAMNGQSVLFRRGEGLSSYTILRFAGYTWTNNLRIHPLQPPGTLPLPSCTVKEESGRIVTETRVVNAQDSLLLRQVFQPALAGDTAYVRITTTLVNMGSDAVRAGTQIVEDLAAGADDNPLCRVDGSDVRYERGWMGTGVPTHFTAEGSGGMKVIGRLRAEGLTAPDLLVAGNWQDRGYLGSAGWDYTPSSLEIMDLATLLRWDELDLQPGESLSFGTDIGFLAVERLALRCEVSQLRLDESGSGYLPDPPVLSAAVKNTGSAALPELRILPALPSAVQLAPGEIPEKVIPAGLLPGAESAVSWRLSVAPAQVDTSYQLNLSITRPTDLQAACACDMRVPAVLRREAAIDCGEPLTLTASAGGDSYLPDPFVIIARIRNEGNTAITNLEAELQFPQEMELAAGENGRKPVTASLAAGASIDVTWRMHALPQAAPRQPVYTVTATADDGISVSCSNTVNIPSLELFRCGSNGIATAGTDFWIAFPPDDVGAAGEHLIVYLLASEDARVEVERPSLGTQTTVQVPAGTMRALEMENVLNDYGVDSVAAAGIRIRSDVPVKVYMETLCERHSDASIALPILALGKRYVTAGYNWSEPYEHIIVLATADGTTVRITPKAMTSGGSAGGQSFDVFLNAGEAYRIQALLAGLGGSLSGTFIDADQPVAVYSGGESGWIPMVSPDGYGFLNPHYEQLIPLEYLGTDYIAVPFRSRLNGDTFLIVSPEPGNRVDMSDGQSRTLLAAGDSWELQLDHPVRISGEKQLLVAQFANSASWDSIPNEYGDGSMLILPPADRLATCHSLVSGILGNEEVPLPNMAVTLQSGQWLQVQDTPLLAAPVFTAECWIRPEASGVIVSRSDDVPTTSDWELIYDAGEQNLLFVTQGFGITDTFRTAPTSVATGKWTHVALTANGPAGRAEVFIDGNRGTSASFSMRLFEASTGLAWGGSFDRSGRAEYEGLIDECRYWDTERTRDQIAAAKDARLPDSDRNGLVAYWSFCENLIDEAGNYHSLSMRGAASIGMVFDLPIGLNCTKSLADSCFVNIAVPGGGEGDVHLNGVKLDRGAFMPISGTSWYAGSFQVPGGVTTVGTPDPRGAAVTAYGFGIHDAYSYLSSFLVKRTVSEVRETVPDAIKVEVYPQPLHESGVLRFTLPSGAAVQAALYDQLGRHVLSVAAGVYGPGTHSRVFHLKNLAAGMYHLVLTAGDFRVQKNLLLLR